LGTLKIGGVGDFVVQGKAIPQKKEPSLLRKALHSVFATI
jgi:hypothetical protein